MNIIIDYGIGNLNSIKSKVEKLGHKSLVTSDPLVISKAQKLILSGVGNFSEGILRLKQGRLIPILSDLVLNKKIPILGICLGMQLFFESSEEGFSTGLSFLKGNVKKFDFSSCTSQLRIPHVGWNSLNHNSSKLFSNIENNKRFYFTHSYYVECPNETTSATCEYGFPFTCAVEYGSIFGVQFHPEKSHSQGLQLLDNFLRL